MTAPPAARRHSSYTVGGVILVLYAMWFGAYVVAGWIPIPLGFSLFGPLYLLLRM
jgi:hypothetical protein